MPAWVTVLFVVVAALCLYGAARLYAAGKPEYGKAVLASVLPYGAVFAAIWIFEIGVPRYTVALTLLTVFGSCFIGHYLQFYNKSKTFDRYLHAFGTFSFALLTYCVLDDFVAAGGSRLYQALFVTLLGNTLGVVFEITEMLHDFKKNVPKCQKGLLDTDMDQVFNLFGSILAGAFAYLWIVG